MKKGLYPSLYVWWPFSGAFACPAGWQAAAVKDRRASGNTTRSLPSQAEDLGVCPLLESYATRLKLGEGFLLYSRIVMSPYTSLPSGPFHRLSHGSQGCLGTMAGSIASVCNFRLVSPDPKEENGSQKRLFGLKFDHQCQKRLSVCEFGLYIFVYSRLDLRASLETRRLGD